MTTFHLQASKPFFHLLFIGMLLTLGTDVSAKEKYSNNIFHIIPSIMPEYNENDSLEIRNDYSWIHNTIRLELDNCNQEKVLIYKTKGEETYVYIETLESHTIYYDDGEVRKPSQKERLGLFTNGLQIDTILADWSCLCGYSCDPIFRDYDKDKYSPIMGDCDDGNSSIYPSAPEIPNDGVDNDCLGSDLDSLQNTTDITSTDDSKFTDDLCNIDYEIKGDTVLIKKFKLTGQFVDTSASNTHFNVYLFNENWEEVRACDYTEYCSNKIRFEDLATGKYNLRIQSFSQNWLELLCDTNIEINLENTSNIIFIDNEPPAPLQNIVTAYASCVDVNIEKVANQLYINKTTDALNSIIELFNIEEGYFPVYRCIGNCNATMIDALEIGKYNLKVKMYDANWNFICELDEDLHFTEQRATFTESSIAQSRRANSFTAYLQQTNIALQWTQLQEKITQSFIIEKSTDGVHFQPFLTKIVTSNRPTYQVLDVYPAEGNNFYRVITFFKDGSKAHSETIHAHWTSPNALNLFPNPATTQTQVNLRDFVGKKIDLILTDIFGRIIHQQHFEKVEQPLIKIDLYSFDSGIYQVSTIHKGTTRNVKLVLARM